jgi:hypothetical protein
MPHNYSPRRISVITFSRDSKREGMSVSVEILGNVENKKIE